MTEGPVMRTVTWFYDSKNDLPCVWSLE